MPRRTSSRPKLLWTSSAFTMGVPLISAMLAPNGQRHIGRSWRWGMEREEHAPEPLDRRQWLCPMRSAAEISLKVKLSHGQDRGHKQVPEACDNQQLQDVVGG